MSVLDLMSPCCPEKHQGWLAESPKAAHANSRMYGILIVDDETCVRDILRIAMRQEGFAVWLAADGQEALDLYQRNQETIDVVLMDVRMPGLDGPQTLAALQNLNPQVRCCFMSGSLGGYTEERLFQLGAVAILPKPFHLEEVGQVIRHEVCHDRQATFANRRHSRPPIGIET